jgi:hypothetical protein
MNNDRTTDPVDDSDYNEALSDVDIWAFDDSDDPQTGDLEQLFCRRCDIYTWHRLADTYMNKRLHKYDIDIDNEVIVSASLHIDRWRIWMCAGCETLLAQHQDFSKGASNPQDRWGYDEDAVCHRPPLPPPHERPAKRYYNMPPKIWELYRQTVAAYNAGALILAAGGVRSLLEAVCMDKGAKDVHRADGQRPYTLEEKMQVLKNFMPQDVFDHLDAVRYLGNDGLHKFKAVPADVDLALSVVESILNRVYELDAGAKDLYERMRKYIRK